MKETGVWKAKAGRGRRCILAPSATNLEWWLNAGSRRELKNFGRVLLFSILFGLPDPGSLFFFPNLSVAEGEKKKKQSLALLDKLLTSRIRSVSLLFRIRSVSLLFKSNVRLGCLEKVSVTLCVCS